VRYNGEGIFKIIIMQTAIDYLAKKFVYLQWLLNRDEVSKAKADILLNQFYIEAKKIERENIIQVIRFMRMNDKMGKSIEDLYNEFIKK